MSGSGIGLELCGLGVTHFEMGCGRVEADRVVWRFPPKFGVSVLVSFAACFISDFACGVR